MKKYIALLLSCLVFVSQLDCNTLEPIDPQDQLPFIMANCFAQILMHGLTAAQANNNKELRVQELSKAIHCFAQFLVQFFNTPKRSCLDMYSSMHIMRECCHDEVFMHKLSECFNTELESIFDAMISHADEHALIESLHFDT